MTIGELSTRRAATYGILATLAGVLLVVLQLTVAQVQGIDGSIGTIQARISDSYQTLGQVVDKAAPTSKMADQVDQVVADQTTIAGTMTTLNGTLREMADRTNAVADATGAMVTTNARASASIAAMSADLRTLTGTIDGLIPASRATGASLASMRQNSIATRAALESIVRKMLAYGLPQASR